MGWMKGGGGGGKGKGGESLGSVGPGLVLSGPKKQPMPFSMTGLANSPPPPFVLGAKSRATYVTAHVVGCRL